MTEYSVSFRLFLLPTQMKTLRNLIFMEETLLISKCKVLHNRKITNDVHSEDELTPTTKYDHDHYDIVSSSS